MPYEVIRSHEICAGHRVVGHESKCRHLHGHNYKFHFHVAPKVNFPEATFAKGSSLDDVGRVIDFSVVKSTLCQWLEDNWDHKFLHWEDDDLVQAMRVLIASSDEEVPESEHFFSSLVSLPFNPTAENLAAYMVETIGPQLLDQHGVTLVKCVIEETSKCHVGYTK